MKIHVEAESIDAIIERQLKLWEAQKAVAEKKSDRKELKRPLITISRGLGALGEDVAARISQLTGFQLLDKEILESIAANSGVQTKIVELLDEHVRSDLKQWFQGTIAGKIFGKTDYVKSLTKTVGSIMKHGDAIIVGRGANIILGPRRGFHLRITGSKDVRANRVAEAKGISLDQAFKDVNESDENRAVFIKKSFGVWLGDPATYDITLNTDNLNVDDAVELALLGYSKKKARLWQLEEKQG